MPYATPTDVRNAWPSIHTAGFVDDELRTMIARGDSIIDAWLAGRYTVPITTTPLPAILKTLSQDLAMIDVFDRAQGTPDFIVRRLERAMELLRALADGTIDLPGVDESTGTGGVQSTTAAYTPTFGVGVDTASTLGERVDWDRVDDELLARD